MANIKINEKVLKELFDRFPNIKTAALAARTECAQTAKASDELFKSAIRTSLHIWMIPSVNAGKADFFHTLRKNTRGSQEQLHLDICRRRGIWRIFANVCRD